METPVSLQNPTPNGEEDWEDPFEIDTTVAHPARRYNYWLGGDENFKADRISGDAFAAAFPTIRIAAKENRRFLHRVVTFLVKEAGIRQFLDGGTLLRVPCDVGHSFRTVALARCPIITG
jgi:hypothetical protein